VASELYFVRVYRPEALYEYEMEIDPDLIGLDDEREAESTDPKREALRLALRRARAGDGEQTRGIREEYIALLWDEVSKLTTFAVLEGSPFDVMAADRMAAAVDLMIQAGRLDARSALGDARLDYGTPFSPEEAERILYMEKRRGDEPGQRETARDRARREGDGAVQGDGQGHPEASGGGGGPEDAGQRAAPRDRRARRVAAVQPRRRSRAGKGVVDDG
jgi:hypothetical protein